MTAFHDRPWLSALPTVDFATAVLTRNYKQIFVTMNDFKERPMSASGRETLSL